VAADDAAARDGAQYPAVGARALDAVSSAFSLHELEELHLHLMPLLLVVGLFSLSLLLIAVQVAQK
jgi:hypothetical protein